MPFKQDKLTERVTEAFKLMQNRIHSGWASQFQCFDAGYRAGYVAGIADNSPDSTDHRSVGASRQVGSIPPADLPAQDKGER
jgi:hypothetical protein